MEEDLVFYQATFVPEGAECVLRYNVRKCMSGEQVPIRYVRREDNETLFKYRLKSVIKFGIAVILSYPLFKLGLYIRWNVKVPYNGGLGIAGIGIMCLFAIPFFLTRLIGLASAPEKKMKSEYYLDSDGNWSSSEK